MEAFNTDGLCPENEGYTPQQQEQEQEQEMLAGNCLLEPQIRPVLWQSPPETAASMKVFTSVMLRAWRKRRENVKQLRKELDGLQKKSMEGKNQLHVTATLMRIEQKRNSELQLQLKQSQLSVSQARSSCASLETTVLTLTADKLHLQQALDIRQKEHEEMQNAANQTKTNLFDSLMEQRNLRNELAKEQLNFQHLQNENNQLLDEVMQLRNMDSEYNKQLENKYKLELQQKDEMLNTLQQNLEQKLQEINNKNNELDQLRDKEQDLTAKIAELLQQIGVLQSSNRSFITKLPTISICIIPFLLFRYYRFVWSQLCHCTSHAWSMCSIYLFSVKQ